MPRELERVELARIQVEPNDAGKVETLPDGSISVPVYEEELIITKRTVLRERVIIKKQTVTENQRVRAELRKERVSVDADEGIELVGTAKAQRRGSDRSTGAPVETRRFFLTSEFLAFIALAIGLIIAALTENLDATTAWVLAAVVVAYAVSRGFAKARTWVSAGPNEDVDAADIRKALDDRQLSQIAEQLGVSEEEAAKAIAQVLPDVVDQATPQGKLPANEELDEKLGRLEEMGGSSVR